MISIADRRTLNVLGFAVCAAMMGYALYVQYGMQLEPCPLCVLQRIAVIALGMIFLVAALHNPAGKGRFAYAGLLSVAMLGGIVVAGRHVWLQSLPPDRVPECGPGLDYMLETFPFTEALRMVFTGSGECAEIDWQFLGLSMPAWVLLWIVLLGGAGIWNNLRGSAS